MIVSGPLGLAGNRADGSLWPCGTCLLPVCPARAWSWPERSSAAILKAPPSWVQFGQGDPTELDYPPFGLEPDGGRNDLYPLGGMDRFPVHPGRAVSSPTEFPPVISQQQPIRRQGHFDGHSVLAPESPPVILTP